MNHHFAFDNFTQLVMLEVISCRLGILFTANFEKISLSFKNTSKAPVVEILPCKKFRTKYPPRKINIFLS